MKFLDNLEEWLITFLIGGATLLIFVAVIHRYAAGAPIPGVQDVLLKIDLSWAQELCIYMFVWMAKFGAAYGVRTGIHVGVDVVIIPKDRAVGVNATVAKVASGAIETVPVIAVTNLARTMRDLKERGIWLVRADAEGKESLFDADLSGPIGWVLGGEGSGLRRLTRELCDRSVSIPLMGSVASLNVSVAAGICLYATRQQRSRASV